MRASLGYYFSLCMRKVDQRVRVLLVEDEPVCLQTMSTILSLNGMEVSSFPDAERGLAALLETAPHVVLTDIRLPGMDGLEFLRRVRDYDADLPVLLITGHSSLESAIAAIQQGARDYLLKPIINHADLVHPVRKAAEHYLLVIRNRSLQQELESNERLFRAMFHGAGDAMFLSLETPTGPGRLKEVNATACRMLECERDSLLKRTVTSFLAPEQRVEARRFFQAAAIGESRPFESVALTLRDRRIPVEVTVHSLLMQHRQLLLTVMRDISGRRDREKKLAEIVEQERRTLGHELHDVLGQDLASMAMIASALSRSLASAPMHARQDANLIHDLSVRSAVFCRRLYSGLMPVELERQGLCSALEQLVSATTANYRVACSFRNRMGVDVKPNAVKLHAYRIAQEAVANAVRHAKATRILITITRKRGCVVMTVQDNGSGISRRKSSSGMGLHIMNDRARMIGAVLEVGPGRGKGTKVTCTWRQT